MDTGCDPVGDSRGMGVGDLRAVPRGGIDRYQIKDEGKTGAAGGGGARTKPVTHDILRVQFSGERCMCHYDVVIAKNLRRVDFVECATLSVQLPVRSTKR